MMKVTPEMDRRHAPDSEAPTWNESWYFNFYDPRADIGGYVRIGLLPNTGTANMWFALFRNGEQIYDRIRFARPIPGGDIVGDGLELDGLRLQADRLLERYRIRYDDAYTGVALDLVWDAVHPAYNNSLRHLHLEQGARFEGSLVLRGAKHALSGTAFRDHATGKRDWEAMGSHELFWPVFGDDSALGIVRVRHRKGLVDAVWSWDGRSFANPSVRNLELRSNPHGLPSGVTAELVGADGSAVRVEGEVLSVCQAFFDGYRIHECMARYTTADGRVGHGLFEVGRRPGEAL